MKGEVFALFSGGGSIEETLSYLLSYYEQEMHFLSLRIGFLKSEKPPKKGPKWYIFDVKNIPFWTLFGGFSDFKNPILSDKKCISCSQ